MTFRYCARLFALQIRASKHCFVCVCVYYFFGSDSLIRKVKHLCGIDVREHEIVAVESLISSEMCQEGTCD